MKKRGFTLLELLIVIIILGILVAIALPRYFANLENAREAEARATLNSIRQAELAYYTVNAPNYDASFPIDVTLGGSQIYLAEPNSSSFTYTLNTTNKYGKATHKAGAGTVDYCMYWETGACCTCP